jgi:hypothetical protein
MQFSTNHSISSAQEKTSSIVIPHMPPGLYRLTLKMDVVAYNPSLSQTLEIQVSAFGHSIYQVVPSSAGGPGSGSTNYHGFWFAELLNLTDGRPELKLAIQPSPGVECSLTATLLICADKL